MFLHFSNEHFGKSRSIVVYYLDDFLLAGMLNTTDCAKRMSCFCSICEDLRVPLAQEKTLGTTSLLKFLGLEINTMPTCMNVKIPYDKSSQLKSGLRFLLTNNNVSLGQLHNLIGLFFSFLAIPSGRAFVRRLFNHTRGLTKPHHRRGVTTEMKKRRHSYLTTIFRLASYHDY